LRVLVTGGAGFIGSHLVDRLVADSHDVMAVDSYSRGSTENLEAALKTGRCSSRVVDVLDAEFVAEARDFSPEIVIHLAAQIDVRASVSDPMADAATNVLGTIAALEVARRSEARKVVLASSVAIFGPPARLPVTELTETDPLSPYAVSKLTGEHYLRQYQRLYGLPTTTLVLTNTYGPRQDPHGEAGVVAIFAERMLRGKTTRVFGDGGNRRDYVYVDDVVDAMIRASAPVAAGRRLVIGTGVGTTDLELHQAVAAAVGGAPEPEFAPARLGDLPTMVVNASEAARVLGWRPRVSLAEGIERTVSAMRERFF
jgi:UDP-glucose 4-epimerase